jgi:U3 small nucleolar RNA-associated protein 19
MPEVLIFINLPLDILTDPFLMNEKDPSKCHASESSLWEIKSIQGHYFAHIIQSAKRVGHNLPEREFDISEKLNTTMDEVSLFV